MCKPCQICIEIRIADRYDIASPDLGIAVGNQSGDGEAREALMALAKHAPSPSANTGSASPGKRRRRRRGPAKSDTVVDVNPGSSEET